MVTVVKSEWHSVEKRYSAEIDEDILAEIYPEMDEDEISQLLKELECGDISVDTIMEDAGWDVNIDWDWLDEDDWWNDRKGGYDITYEVSK